jgi:hypothetical protein
MIRRILAIWIVCLFGSTAAESLLTPVNRLGLGTVALRLQTLSMVRDYEGAGNGYSTTIGWKLDYLSPEWNGLSAGLSYLHVEVPHTAGGAFGSDGEGLLFNGRVSVLNEAWLKYTPGAWGLTNTFVKAGRQVVNGEVFRADEFRQKPRALEAVLLTSKDIPGTTLTFGHAKRLSNVWDSDSSGDRLTWRFKEIEDVLGANTSTRGVTWGEAVNTSVTNLEIAAYDAYAHDIVNVAGGRAVYTLSGRTALNGWYRHERGIGRGTGRSSDMIGASVQQNVGGVLLEPGFLSIGGDGLFFSELYTGIHHPLGSSMMIYSAMFDGGADTYYLKATARIDDTLLYLLYNYTTHDTTAFEGQELNVVVKQLFSDRFSVALKVGLGYRDGKSGTDDTVATDTRLFATYHF